MPRIFVLLLAAAGVLAVCAAAPAGPTLPPRPVEGGLVLGDTNTAQKYVLPTGVTGLDSFQATLTRQNKLILDFALPWDWETPERAAKAASGEGRVNRLPWSSASDAAFVLKAGDGELVCPLADANASPDLLSFGGSISDARAGPELFKTLQDADSPTILRLRVARDVMTPAVDLRLKIDRARVTERLEQTITVLGGRLTAMQLDASARELLRERVITFTVGDGVPVDPSARNWLTELAVKRFVGVLREQALREVMPTDAPKTPPKDNPKAGDAHEPTFAWDRTKVTRFVKEAGEITGNYSTVIAFHQTLTIPVKRLKVSDQRGGFLDLRGK
jgi:hypothetical protein